MNNPFTLGVNYWPRRKAMIGGQNYGQASSREHAALAPRYLGLRMVIAQSAARIHSNHLINFGSLPVMFDNPAIFNKLEAGDVIAAGNVHKQIQAGNGKLNLPVSRKNFTFTASHPLTPPLIEILLAGGRPHWFRKERRVKSA